MIVQIYTYYIVEDALAIARLGADHIGITVMGELWKNKVYLRDPAWREVFEKTTLDVVREIFRLVKGKVKRVFMPLSDDLDEMVYMFRYVDGDILHLINAFNREEFREVKKKIGASELMASIFLTKGGFEENRREVERALEIDDVVDYLLLDTKVGEWTGVTGRAHNWNISKYIVENSKAKVILAGGLNPDNVVDALDKVRPHGVDACTGLDVRPGKKDLRKVEEFIRRVGEWKKTRV